MELSIPEGRGRLEVLRPLGALPDGEGLHQLVHGDEASSSHGVPSGIGEGEDLGVEVEDGGHEDSPRGDPFGRVLSEQRGEDVGEGAADGAAGECEVVEGRVPLGHCGSLSDSVWQSPMLYHLGRRLCIGFEEKRQLIGLRHHTVPHFSPNPLLPPPPVLPSQAAATPYHFLTLRATSRQPPNARDADPYHDAPCMSTCPQAAGRQMGFWGGCRFGWPCWARGRRGRTSSGLPGSPPLGVSFTPTGLPLRSCRPPLRTSDFCPRPGGGGIC